jgi:RHS repeat-associated protein
LFLAVFGALATRAARPRPEPCPGGRFLLDPAAPPLVPGAVGPEVLVLEADGAVSITSGCELVTAVVKAKRKATKVRATFPTCGSLANAKLRVKIVAPTCTALSGTLKVKREKVRKFTGRLVPCGDGVVEPDGGEECEPGVVACGPGFVCQPDCTCEPGASTTSTMIGGSTTTSSTIAPTTSTTIGGGTTTTTTLPTVPGPDPSTTAPPLDAGATSSFAAATAFLYAGASPVQFNVAAGAIDPLRAAVVRGTVLDDAGAPLEGVLIRVLDHPEFGQTLSRSDGAFDLVVNGGGPLTLDYAKSGFLPVQRRVQVPWQDYVPAPEVRLCPLDSNATQVELGTLTDIAVARGSEKTDGDGTRQATLLVEPGTTAQMVMPDGSTHPLTQLTIRATEFTVGAAGPEMMPAVLPPESGYTYAVEFSADEALQSGASMVTFDRPIPTYVENFPGFPAGTTVPAGYYDYARGAWIAAPNGRVIDVVASTGGLADLDVTGDGAADTGTALTDLGIDDAERQKLATLYAPGTSLWRVPVDHFTPWDYNWPAGPPDDADDPADLGAGATSDDEPLDGSCEAEGSTIECENQVLGETVLVGGTPYALYYRSDRVPGRLDSLDVVVSGPSVPASLVSMRVRASVAGHDLEQSFAPAPNQTTVLTWDGTDVYGRPVQGGQRVTGSIEYHYPAVYRTPSEFVQSFGRLGGANVGGDRTTSSITVSMPFAAVLREGITDARGLGLGGWTLGVHHFYDPTTQVLHLGSGQRRRADSVARVIDASGIDPLSGGRLTRPLAIGPDGSFYFQRTGSATTVRRLRPDGTEIVIAGGGSQGFPEFGDGGPALDAQIANFADQVTLGPDGSVYILDGSVVRRIGSDGIIRRVAGRWSSSTCGSPDGGLATETDICTAAQGLTVGPDGSIFFVDQDPTSGIFGTFRLRRVGTDGIITTIAGNNETCAFGLHPCGDGGLATAARFNFLLGPVAVGPDGSVYVVDGHAIRRIRPDGIIEAFAGTIDQQGFFGDGGPATSALLCGPQALAFGPDGALFVSDKENRRVRRIAADGVISTIAGSGAACDFPAGNLPQTGDRGPALQATIPQTFALAVAPDGTIFISAIDPSVPSGGFTIRRIGLPLPGFSDTDILVASEDGRSLYGFDPSGRHLRTFDALTGAVRREFAYDAAGRLAQITEKTGGTDNVTTIERDAAGNPTAIVGPFGKRTTITVDVNGFLASITNPAGETTALASTASGLLTSFTAPGNRTSTFDYDAAGRLLRDDDPGDGAQDLARTGPPAAFTVTRSTALGRDTTYQVETLPNRVTRRTITAPDGTAGIVTENVDAATRESSAPSGTVTTLAAGGDPRFGVEAPVTTSVSVAFPSGLDVVATNARAATVADPFDPLSLVTLEETSTVDANTFTTAYTASTRTFLTTTPLGRTRTLTIDALGRPVTLQASGGETTTAAYDTRGRLASLTTGSGPTARAVTYTYDAQGLPATVTDPLGRTVTMERDAVGRLTRKILPDGDAIELGFDAAGDFVSLTPPGRPAYTFTYDARGALASIVPPAVPGTGPTTHTYDDDGALTAVTRPDESVTFTDDAAGRLATIDLAVQGGSQGTYAFTYDATTGQVTRIDGPGGATLEYAYDGSLVTDVVWGGPVTGSLAVQHDARLAVATETVNGTSAISFVHDADDNLVAAGDLAITRSAATGLPSATALGVVSDAWVHDGFGDLVDHEATANGSPIYVESYEYDALGRITRKVETIGGSTDTIEYTYDAKGRLTQVTRDGNTVESYTYDPNGNRTAATVGGSSITATYDDQDRLLTYGSATFTHSASGRVSTRSAPGGTTSYTYDAAGNLLAVSLPGGTDVTYALDPGMRRVARDVGGVAAERFLWSGNRAIAQLDDTGVLVSRFVYAGGPAPAYLVTGGIAHRLIVDHAGSVRLVVNAETGAVVQRLDYDSFGRVTLDTNPGFQPFGFAGGLYDPATGLVRFDTRDYDATTGRWTAKDPIGFAGLDTNLYRYAGNDPVNRTDPNGLTVAEIATGILAGLVDVAMLPATLAHDLSVLGAALTEAITGIPQPVPPDPNFVVRGMEDLNELADAFFDAEPLVDTDSTAFRVSRICTSVAAELGAGVAAGAARGAAEGTLRAGVRPALQATGKGVSRTADEAYRPLASANAARAERLAAENAKRVAQQEAKQAAQQAGERGRLELVRPEGNGAGTRGTGKAAGGLGLGR